MVAIFEYCMKKLFFFLLSPKYCIYNFFSKFILPSPVIILLCYPLGVFGSLFAIFYPHHLLKKSINCLESGNTNKSSTGFLSAFVFGFLSAFVTFDLCDIIL